MRRLDADVEPEVILDVYSGGAHCCTSSRVYRYLARGAYAHTVHEWGNVGYRLADLDRDGAPEFASRDDFSYAFSSYAASFSPIQVWQYEAGRLLDVTRRFPSAIRRDAEQLWREYLRVRKLDARGVLAAWVADQALLERYAAGRRALQTAYRRGELGRGATRDGFPAGRRYIAAVDRFLRRKGYVR